MTIMTPDALGLPRSRPLTADDLDAMPDDGRRYELIDGVLLVSPSPWHVHQRGVGNLHLVMRAAVPDDLEVLLAPFDVRLADDTVMIPDLLVARRTDVTERNLPTAPVLAVEVLSPSTRSFDLHTKKDRFRRSGCAHYWVVDPVVPSITAWRLVDEAYVVAGEAAGVEALVLEQPFPVRVVPQELVDR